MKLDQAWIKKWGPCQEGVSWLKNQKERDGLLVIKALISQKKLSWANWLIVRIMGRKQYLAYAIFASEQVLDIYEKKYPNDDRPRKAIEAAKAVLKNDTEKNRDAAYSVYTEVARASSAAYKVEGAAAQAATSVAHLAYAAASMRYLVANEAASATAYAAADAVSDTESETMRLKILLYGIKLLEKDKK